MKQKGLCVFRAKKRKKTTPPEKGRRQGQERRGREHRFPFGSSGSRVGQQKKPRGRISSVT